MNYRHESPPRIRRAVDGEVVEAAALVAFEGAIAEIAEVALPVAELVMEGAVKKEM